MTTTEPAFTCTRWRRFGHDRLYVATAGGEKLGYRDLATGLDHPVSEADRALLHALADDWGAVAPEPVAASAPAPWLDLSHNRPGEAAREVALDKRAEAPVRTALARALGVRNDERAWRIGADGEQLVAAELARVARRDPAWTALHAIPVGTRGADIDHLVIGPGGIFTVNAKHHPGADIWVGGGTLLVNGARTHHIRNARHEAERAARLLSAAVGEPVPVHGLVVTVNAKTFTVKQPPRPGVDVLPRRQLAAWLRRLGPALDQDRLNRIWDAARRSTTWRPPGGVRG